MRIPIQRYDWLLLRIALLEPVFVNYLIAVRPVRARIIVYVREIDSKLIFKHFFHACCT